MSFNNWEKLRLGDVICFNPRESITKKQHAKKIAMEKIQPYTKFVKNYENSEYAGGAKFRNGDTLLARITPCLENGKTSQVTILDDGEVGFGSTEFIVLREKKEISNNDFIYYLSISKQFRTIAIQSMVGTSGRQRVQQEALENTIILFPSLPEQKAIAKTLSYLDDKIELNSRINDNLAKQGKSMFYKLMNEDFGITSEIGQLSDIAYINQLYKLKKGQVSTYVEMSNLPTKGSFPTAWEERAYNGGAKFMNGDTIMARISPCLENGKTAFINFLQKEVVGWGSTEYIVLSPKHPAYSEFLYFLARDKDFVRYAIMNMSGTSGRQRVSGDVIGKYEIVLPQIEKVENFSLYATTIMTTIYENCIQNIELGKLRDVLLPKLMSGEIEVSQISN